MGPRTSLAPLDPPLAVAVPLISERLIDFVGLVDKRLDKKEKKLYEDTILS